MTPDVAMHIQLRGRGSLVAMAGVLGFYTATAWSPTMQQFWGVGPWTIALSGASCLAAGFIAAWSFRHHGQRSLSYCRINALETCTYAATCLFVIAASERPMNPMWLFHLGHMVHCGTAGFQRVFNTRLFAVLSLGVVGYFALLGHWGNTGIAFLLALFSFYSYSRLARSAELLRATTLERDALAQQVTELRLEEERQRIARDLHDGFAGDLAALHWQIEGLRATLPRDESSERFFDTLRQRLTQGADELRNIVWALRAGDLYWCELIEHLRTRSQELCGDALLCEFDASGEPDVALSSDVHVQVARFVQEAVRNAVRHSGADRVSVRLSLGTQLEVSVTDDGRGIAPERLAGARGGLLNLRRRMEALGGGFEIENALSGTTLRATIPFSS